MVLTTALPTVDIAAADAYFATTSRDALWQAITDKDIWLNEAKGWLGQLCYDTTKDCCGNDFNAAYTRAVSELALALQQSPAAIVSAAGSSPSQLVRRQKLGDLEVEYQAPTAGTAVGNRYGPNAPLVLQRFPWLGDVLSCWLKTPTGSARIIARVRS
jgi:hypothetical protein